MGNVRIREFEAVNGLLGFCHRKTHLSHELPFARRDIGGENLRAAVSTLQQKIKERRSLLAATMDAFP